VHCHIYCFLAQRLLYDRALDKRVAVKTEELGTCLSAEDEGPVGQIEWSVDQMRDDPETKSTELEETRAHLAATREVLNVISTSRGKLQPVLDLIVSTATRLCEADYSLFFQDFGDGFIVTASDNARPEVISFYNANPLVPTHGTIVGRAALTKEVVHIPDFLADPDHNTPDRRRIAAVRAGLGVPLIQDGKTIAVMTVLRTEAKPFTDRHINLVETFSEQCDSCNRQCKPRRAARKPELYA